MDMVVAKDWLMVSTCHSGRRGQPCHLTEPDGTSELAREHACPGGLCHGQFTYIS